MVCGLVPPAPPMKPRPGGGVRVGATGELDTAGRRPTACYCRWRDPVLARIQLGARMSLASVMIQVCASSASMA